MSEKPQKIYSLFQADRLYTIPEVAEILRKKALWVWTQIDSGKLPGYRYSRHWVIKGVDLNSWLESHRIAA